MKKLIYPFESSFIQWLLVILVIVIALVFCYLGNLAFSSSHRFTALSVISKNADYATDGVYVYSHYDIVHGADPKTFRVLGDCGCYAVDKNQAYYDDEIMDGVDAKTFSGIDDVYAKDSQAVYYEGKKIADADASTFSSINGTVYYKKDAKSIYYYGEAITGSDPSTVVSFSNDLYLKDAKQVYYDGYAILGADVKTFTSNPILDYNVNYDAYDKIHHYKHGSIVK